MTNTSPPVFDWEGNPVTEPESPDKEILVRHVSPALIGNFDAMVVRGYQHFLQHIESGLHCLLDDKTEEELTDGVSITIKLIKTTVGQYVENCDHERHNPARVGDEGSGKHRL